MAPPGLRVVVRDLGVKAAAAAEVATKVEGILLDATSDIWRMCSQRQNVTNINKTNLYMEDFEASRCISSASSAIKTYATPTPAAASAAARARSQPGARELSPQPIARVAP